MQETQIQSLGQEDPLEKELTTHSSILACRIPWTEKPGGPWGGKELDTTEQLHDVMIVIICITVDPLCWFLNFT